MMGGALEITIIVSVVVLAAYPGGLTLLDVLHERYARRVRVARRGVRGREGPPP